MAFENRRGWQGPAGYRGAFNSSTHKSKVGRSLYFQASLVFSTSSRSARAVTQRNPVEKQIERLFGWDTGVKTDRKDPFFCCAKNGNGLIS